MADQRLQWRQLQQSQPNVAGLMAASGAAFNNGMDAASGILAKYTEGRKAIGDKEAMHRLASINDEAELDQFLAGGGLSDLEVSDKLLGELGAARGNTVGLANDRSITNDRNVRTGIAQDVNGRAGDLHGIAMNDENFRIGRRDELAGLSGDVVRARVEGQDYGTASPNGGGPQGSPDAFTNYINSTIQSESGGRADAKNPNSSATGLGQFVTGTWNEMMKKHPDLGLTPDGRTDPEQSKRALVRFTEDNAKILDGAGIPINEGNLYAAHFLGAGGARTVLSADDNAKVSDLLPPEVTKANPFLSGMSVGEFRSWSAKKGGGNAPAAQNRTPARDALETRLAESSFLSPEDVTGLLNTNDTFVDQGTSAAAQERARLQEELLAGMTMDAVANPDNATTADVQREIAQAAAASGEFSKSEQLAAQLGAETTIGSSEGIQTQLAPGVAEDVRVSNVIEGTAQDTQAALEATPTGRMMRDTEAFAENPTEGLITALGLGEDGEDLGKFGAFFMGKNAGFDKNDITNLVNKYARDNKVTPAQAAAAMREAFDRDPLGLNTLGRRFNEKEVANVIKENLSQTNVTKYNDDNRMRAEYEQQQRTIAEEIQSLQRQAAKGGDRTAIGAEIASLYTELAALRSEAQKLYRGDDDL